MSILLTMSIATFGQNTSRYDDPLYQTVDAVKEIRNLFKKDGSGKGETKKRDDKKQRGETENSNDVKEKQGTDGVVDDVTLIVSGSDVTEKEATLNALRSAIEQVYGTFVSANTEILNDELVKDEIVSVSKGNVKNYEKVSVAQLPNGQTSVTLKATVSRSKLIKYAKSKGSSAEFEGQTFAMNIKLMELRSKNAMKAYEHMCEEIIALLRGGAFDYKVELGEPVVAYAKTSGGKSDYGNNSNYFEDGGKDPTDVIKGYSVPITISVLATPITSQIVSLVNNTLNAIKLSSSEISDFTKIGMGLYNYSKCGIYVRGIAEANDIVLPFGSEPVECDAQVNCSAISAFLDYYLESISDPYYMLSWQNSNNEIKAISIKVPSSDSRYWTPVITGNKGNYLCLIDPDWNCFSSMAYSRYQSRPCLYYGIKPYDGSYNYGEWFTRRIDLSSNWGQWLLPESETIKEGKKKAKEKGAKSSDKSKASYVEQIICQYSLKYFIPKDELAEFKGFTLHKSSDNK